MRFPAIGLLAALLVAAPTLCLADDDSHYRPEVTVMPLLKTATNSAGLPLQYLQTDHPEVTALLVQIPPGQETGWHVHPVPGYAYILNGSLELQLEGGKTVRYEEGQALAEVVNVRHNGRNVGEDTASLVVFFTGSAQQPFTVKTPAP